MTPIIESYALMMASLSPSQQVAMGVAPIIQILFTTFAGINDFVLAYQ
jgi:hypothetical protein